MLQRLISLLTMSQIDVASCTIQTCWAERKYDVSNATALMHYLTFRKDNWNKALTVWSVVFLPENGAFSYPGNIFSEFDVCSTICSRRIQLEWIAPFLNATPYWRAGPSSMESHCGTAQGRMQNLDNEVFFQLSSWLIFAFIVLAVVYKSVKFCDKFPDYC